MKTHLSILLCGFLLTGCVISRHSVIAVTGTVLGVEVAQNPANQMYHAKFGYSRAEIVYVPGYTNAATGSIFTPDVITELRLQNIFSGGGVYQRLAVGTEAVQQPGAALMFAKDANGTVDPVAATALMSVRAIPAPDATVTRATLPLASAYRISTKKDQFDAIAKKYGFNTFADFLLSPTKTQDVVDKIAFDLKTGGLLP